MCIPCIGPGTRSWGRLASQRAENAFTRAKDGPFGSVSWAGNWGAATKRRVGSTNDGPIANRPQVTNLPHKCFRINTGVEGFWRV